MNCKSGECIYENFRDDQLVFQTYNKSNLVVSDEDNETEDVTAPVSSNDTCENGVIKTLEINGENKTVCIENGLPYCDELNGSTSPAGSNSENDGTTSGSETTPAAEAREEEEEDEPYCKEPMNYDPSDQFYETASDYVTPNNVIKAQYAGGTYNGEAVNDPYSDTVKTLDPNNQTKVYWGNNKSKLLSFNWPNDKVGSITTQTFGGANPYAAQGGSRLILTVNGRTRNLASDENPTGEEYLIFDQYKQESTDASELMPGAVYDSMSRYYYPFHDGVDVEGITNRLIDLKAVNTDQDAINHAQGEMDMWLNDKIGEWNVSFELDLTNVETCGVVTAIYMAPMPSDRNGAIAQDGSLYNDAQGIGFSKSQDPDNLFSRGGRLEIDLLEGGYNATQTTHHGLMYDYNPDEGVPTRIGNVASINGRSVIQGVNSMAGDPDTQGKETDPFSAPNVIRDPDAGAVKDGEAAYGDFIYSYDSNDKLWKCNFDKDKIITNALGHNDPNGIHMNPITVAQNLDYYGGRAYKGVSTHKKITYQYRMIPEKIDLKDALSKILDSNGDPKYKSGDESDATSHYRMVVDTYMRYFETLNDQGNINDLEDNYSRRSTTFSSGQTAADYSVGLNINAGLVATRVWKDNNSSTTDSNNIDPNACGVDVDADFLPLYDILNDGTVVNYYDPQHLYTLKIVYRMFNTDEQEHMEKYGVENDEKVNELGLPCKAYLEEYWPKTMLREGSDWIMDDAGQYWFVVDSKSPNINISGTLKEFYTAWDLQNMIFTISFWSPSLVGAAGANVSNWLDGNNSVTAGTDYAGVGPGELWIREGNEVDWENNKGVTEFSTNFRGPCITYAPDKFLGGNCFVQDKCDPISTGYYYAQNTMTYVACQATSTELQNATCADPFQNNSNCCQCGSDGLDFAYNDWKTIKTDKNYSSGVKTHRSIFGNLCLSGVTDMASRMEIGAEASARLTDDSDTYVPIWSTKYLENDKVGTEATPYMWQRIYSSNEIKVSDTSSSFFVDTLSPVPSYNRYFSWSLDYQYRGFNDPANAPCSYIPTIQTSWNAAIGAQWGVCTLEWQPPTDKTNDKSFRTIAGNSDRAVNLYNNGNAGCYVDGFYDSRIEPQPETGWWFYEKLYEGCPGDKRVRYANGEYTGACTVREDEYELVYGGFMRTSDPQYEEDAGLDSDRAETRRATYLGNLSPNVLGYPFGYGLTEGLQQGWSDNINSRGTIYDNLYDSSADKYDACSTRPYENLDKTEFVCNSTPYPTYISLKGVPVIVNPPE